MGCDIHLFVEKKVGGRWHRWERTEEVKVDDAYAYTRNYYGYNDRNYDVFAMLADVRNGRGFAGVETGSRFNVIAAPKGIPPFEKLELRPSGEVQEEIERWDGDGHSHSYLTLAELEAYDWTQKREHHGV